MRTRARLPDYIPPPAKPWREIVPYAPPTLDDLAILRKGSGGAAVDRAYWTPRMWAAHRARYRWWKPWTW